MIRPLYCVRIGGSIPKRLGVGSQYRDRGRIRSLLVYATKGAAEMVRAGSLRRRARQIREGVSLCKGNELNRGNAGERPEQGKGFPCLNSSFQTRHRTNILQDGAGSVGLCDLGRCWVSTTRRV